MRSFGVASAVFRGCEYIREGLRVYTRILFIMFAQLYYLALEVKLMSPHTQNRVAKENLSTKAQDFSYMHTMLSLLFRIFAP